MEALIIVFCVGVYGYTIEALHTITRFSGRLSLLAFSVILLLYNRRGVMRLDLAFLLFAVLHGIHLVELLLYVSRSETAVIPIRAVGGSIAYLMIFAMPFIVVRHERGKLTNKTFNKIETVYFSYIWLIFFLTYLPRVMGTLPDVGGTFTEHVILFSWVILLGVIKMVTVIGAKMQT
jgi:hypothetical protein